MCEPRVRVCSRLKWQRVHPSWALFSTSNKHFGHFRLPNINWRLVISPNGWHIFRPAAYIATHAGLISLHMILPSPNRCLHRKRQRWWEGELIAPYACRKLILDSCHTSFLGLYLKLRQGNRFLSSPKRPCLEKGANNSFGRIINNLARSKLKPVLEGGLKHSQKKGWVIIITGHWVIPLWSSLGKQLTDALGKW